MSEFREYLDLVEQRDYWREKLSNLEIELSITIEKIEQLTDVETELKRRIGRIREELDTIKRELDAHESIEEIPF